MTPNTKRPLSGNSVAKPKIRLGQTILRPADSIISYLVVLGWRLFLND